MPVKRNSPAQPPRILLVDDNQHGNIARKQVLEEHAWSVETALSGEEALEMFLRRPFDLVVTDLKMKKMSGIDLISQLRNVGSTAPVILLSGFVSCLGLTAEDTGADAVLTKSNHEAEHLARTVRQLLTRRVVRKPVASAATNAPPAAASVARSG